MQPSPSKIAVDKFQKAALALTTAYECSERELKAANATKTKQMENRRNARRSLKHIGPLSAGDGRQMVHTLRDKALSKARNRSEAAKKAAITHAKNAALKQQATAVNAAVPHVPITPKTP